MRSVHVRLRRALSITREALAAERPVQGLPRQLLLFCHGFCTALNGHHEAEDRVLFPAVVAAHPQLQETLRKLQQDHSMIAHLVAGLQAAVDSTAPPDELMLHLDGIEAIMESHFRYEERQLLAVLETLELDTDPASALGPL